MKSFRQMYPQKWYQFTDTKSSLILLYIVLAFKSNKNIVWITLTWQRDLCKNNKDEFCFTTLKSFYKILIHFEKLRYLTSLFLFLPPPFCWQRYGNLQIFPNPTQKPSTVKKNWTGLSQVILSSSIISIVTPSFFLSFSMSLLFKMHLHTVTM